MASRRTRPAVPAREAQRGPQPQPEPYGGDPRGREQDERRRAVVPAESISSADRGSRGEVVLAAVAERHEREVGADDDQAGDERGQRRAR